MADEEPTDPPAFCWFRWRDQEGVHRCFELGEHAVHVCCCEATMECGHG